MDWIRIEQSRTPMSQGHFMVVYQHFIKPACIDAGFTPIRADEVNQTNYIALDVLKRLVDADMAVCDISSRNPNVLYELGIRHATKKPVTLLKDTKTDRIFDIQGIRYLSYDVDLRIDKIAPLVSELSTMLENTFKQSGHHPNSLMHLIQGESHKVHDPPDTPKPLSALDALAGSARLDVKAKVQLRGTLTEWNGTYGRIVAAAQSFYVNTRFLAKGTNVAEGSIVFFKPMPPMRPHQNPIASCTFALNSNIVGDIVFVNRERGFAFVQVIDKNGNSQQIYTYLEDAISENDDGATVTCIIEENAEGPIGRKVQLSPALATAQRGIRYLRRNKR